MSEGEMLPDGIAPDDDAWTVINGHYSRAKRSYHVDADCHHLEDSKTKRITAAEAARDGIAPCTSCATSAPTHNDGGDTSVLEAVQQHVYEQTGDDPLADDQAFGGP
jgi:hypothetical protein